MIERAEVFQAAVTLLCDLAPYDQCRHVVQMVYEGSLTHEQGKDLLYALVDHEIDVSAQRHRSNGGPGGESVRLWWPCSSSPRISRPQTPST